MGIKYQRVRGSRRKKIEKAIIEAGYIYQYQTESYQAKLKVRAAPRIDTVRLAKAMNMEKLTFTRNYSNVEGLSLQFAKQIIELLQDKHDINLKINFSDFSS
jgi:hypothetical protein